MTWKQRKASEVKGHLPGGLGHQGVSVQSVTGEAVERAGLQGDTSDAAILLLHQAKLLHHAETCRRTNHRNDVKNRTELLLCAVPLLSVPHLPVCCHSSEQTDKLWGKTRVGKFICTVSCWISQTLASS